MQSVLTLPAHMLLPGDVIHFGEDLCFVVEAETRDPYLDESITALVTEGFGGSQYIDYIKPHRQFTVVRNQ